MSRSATTAVVPIRRVAVIGELLWDLLANASLRDATAFRRVPGGAAANVALALAEARNDAEVAVMGHVGDDASGEGLLRALAVTGVSVEAVVQRRGRTGLVCVGAPVSGGQQFMSYREGKRPRRLRLPPEWRRGLLPDAWLHVAAVHPAELDLLQQLVAAVARRGCRVSVDLNIRPRVWRGVSLTATRRKLLGQMIDCATFVKASDDDLKTLGVDDVRSLGEDAQVTRVVTRRAKPAQVHGPWRSFRAKPPALGTAWGSGAGDAFCAGLIAEHVAGVVAGRGGWQRIVAAAHACASAHLMRMDTAARAFAGSRSVRS